MRLRTLLLAFAAWPAPTLAFAASCPSLPYVFTNGTVIYAAQVNSDFNSILGCLHDQIAITDTTASTSSSTGALTVAGGVGIAGTLWLGNNVDLKGGNEGTPILISSYKATMLGAGGPSVMAEFSNALPAGTNALPPALYALGSLAVGSNGNSVFGEYSEADLLATGGGVAVGAEITASNQSGNAPDASLPPHTNFGTAYTVPIGLNITCDAGQSKDCAVGINLTNNTGSYGGAAWNTAEYIGIFRQYGIYVDQQTSGTQTSEVLINNGNGLNLHMVSASKMGNFNSIADAFVGPTATWAINQEGDEALVGHLLLGTGAIGGTATRPTVSSCGTGPSANRSNDRTAR